MGSASSPWEVRRNRGASGHEVVFVYGGRVDRLEEVVTPEGGTFHDGDVPIRVEWRPLDDAGADVPLYPDGVAGLLGRPATVACALVS